MLHFLGDWAVMLISEQTILSGLSLVLAFVAGFAQLFSP
jgi:hypothetical protein